MKAIEQLLPLLETSDLKHLEGLITRRLAERAIVAQEKEEERKRTRPHVCQKCEQECPETISANGQSLCYPCIAVMTYPLFKEEVAKKLKK